MTPPRAATSPRRPVPAPERPRLEVLRGRPVPGRRPPSRFVAITVVLTCVMLFALVAAQVVVGQASINVADLTARVGAKRIAAEQLELDVARLRAPARIAARATQLGLGPAGAVTVLPLEEPSSSPRGHSPKRERP